MDTKYYKTSEETSDELSYMTDKELSLATPVMQNYEEQMFNFIMYLCF